MNEDIIVKKIVAESKYYDKIISMKMNNDFDMEFAVSVSRRFLENKDIVYSLAEAKELDIDFILYSDVFKIKLLQAIISSKKFNDELEINLNGDEYLDFIVLESYRLLLTMNFYDNGICSAFLSNKVISLANFMLELLKEKIPLSIDDALERDVYTFEIRDLIDSMTSVFQLFDRKCHSQAMSVFRQALEIFITIKTLNMYKEALPSFINHQAITIEDALEHLSKKDLDLYITNNNLTYNNYKSYLNYGWLDSIEVFRKMKEENPKIKYSIKTVAQISDSMEFYDAMNFASNYVHSNFVFVDINWDIVISEVMDGCFQMIDFMIELIKDKSLLIVNGIDYLKLYQKEKDGILKVINKDNYIFD